MNNLRVESPDGFRVSVYLDDTQIFPSRLQLDADANRTDVIHVTLEIPTYQIGLMVRGATVDIAQETKDLLVKLGWTPPEGSESEDHSS